MRPFYQRRHSMSRERRTGKFLLAILAFLHGLIVPSFAAPSILTVSPGNAPAMGGGSFTFLIIEGSGFGSDRTAVAVFIDGKPSPQIRSVTAGVVIVCLIPAGAGSQHAVIVTVNAEQVSLASSFSYDPPEVTAVTPQFFPTTGGSLLTVLGSNFAVEDFNPDVFLDESVVFSVWISDSSIIGSLQEGTGGGKSASVNVRSQAGLLPDAFSYQAPAPSIVHPTTLATDGSATITVTGSHFGTVDMTTKGWMGGSSWLQTSWTSDSALVCVPRPGLGCCQDATVLVDEQFGIVSGAAAFAVPSITDLSVMFGAAAERTPLLLLGSSFGVYDSSPAVRIGLSKAIGVRWTSDSSLRCLVISGTGSDLVIIAEAEDQGGAASA
eukprot:900088-Rhodomonas_salina.2